MQVSSISAGDATGVHFELTSTCPNPHYLTGCSDSAIDANGPTQADNKNCAGVHGIRRAGARVAQQESARDRASPRLGFGVLHTGADAGSGSGASYSFDSA
jgi:hypothetical protein